MRAIRIKEAEFQQQIIDLAHLKGWMVAHFRGVRVLRRDGSTYYQTPVQADGKGFPDLVLVRDRVIFAEVKTKHGKQDFHQELWMDGLIKAGAEYHLWFPKDWDSIVDCLE